MDGHSTKRRRKIAEYFNRLSRVHERYRQTDRQTDGRQNTPSSRSLTKNNNTSAVAEMGDRLARIDMGRK